MHLMFVWLNTDGLNCTAHGTRARILNLVLSHFGMLFENFLSTRERGYKKKIVWSEVLLHSHPWYTRARNVGLGPKSFCTAQSDARKFFIFLVFLSSDERGKPCPLRPTSQSEERDSCFPTPMVFSTELKRHVL